jgi:predicted signal transduction protein with EAL and GGDEF domain
MPPYARETCRVVAFFFAVTVVSCSFGALLLGLLALLVA